MNDDYEDWTAPKLCNVQSLIACQLILIAFTGRRFLVCSKLHWQSHNNNNSGIKFGLAEGNNNKIEWSPSFSISSSFFLLLEQKFFLFLQDDDDDDEEQTFANEQMNEHNES